jgi:hypothetical protein
LVIEADGGELHDGAGRLENALLYRKVRLI